MELFQNPETEEGNECRLDLLEKGRDGKIVAATHGRSERDGQIFLLDNLKKSSTHPKFLNSNSTSHRWAFSAIAELVDNCADEDVSSPLMMIDVVRMTSGPMLAFLDAGNGMDKMALHRMLSFGYSDKRETSSSRPIGYYGNGFKSGSMRLGRDVVVLSQTANERVVGLLSQTFLNIDDKWVMEDTQDIKQSLAIFFHYTFFTNEEDLALQFREISLNGSKTGTIITIWNLRQNDGEYELDFDSDMYDIRLRHGSDNPVETSLRAYLEILYKDPKMKIILRHRKVRTQRVSSLVENPMFDVYQPRTTVEKALIRIGYHRQRFNVGNSPYGMLIYFRGRLIKRFMRVGVQLEANRKGIGIIGVIDADFLWPTHNKQDFNDDKLYRGLIKRLADAVSDYWWQNEELSDREVRRKIRNKKTCEVNEWVQCDSLHCRKWRRLPPGFVASSLSEHWYCTDHPDPNMRSHDIEEEPYEDHITIKQEVKLTKKRKRNIKILKNRKQSGIQKVIDVENKLSQPRKSTREHSCVIQGEDARARASPRNEVRNSLQRNSGVIDTLGKSISNYGARTLKSASASDQLAEGLGNLQSSHKRADTDRGTQSAWNRSQRRVLSPLTNSLPFAIDERFDCPDRWCSDEVESHGDELGVCDNEDLGTSASHNRQDRLDPSRSPVDRFLYKEKANILWKALRKLAIYASQEITSYPDDVGDMTLKRLNTLCNRLVSKDK